MAKHAPNEPKDKPVQAPIKPLRKRETQPPQTKRAQLIQMLSAKNGAGADVICRKFGWQPHTTRAAMSRLRQAGFDIHGEKPGRNKPTRYRILAEPMLEAGANAA